MMTHPHQNSGAGTAVRTTAPGVAGCETPISFANTGATRSADVPKTGGDVPVLASLLELTPGAQASGGFSAGVPG